MHAHTHKKAMYFFAALPTKQSGKRARASIRGKWQVVTYSFCACLSVTLKRFNGSNDRPKSWSSDSTFRTPGNSYRYIAINI